jgi:hypothetical protein
MKRLVVIAFVLGLAHSMTAQVTLRNDFVFSVKEKKFKNKGITFVAINLSRFTNWNYLLNGRGGNVLSIDVRAIKNRNKYYSYTDLAEKVYVPAASTLPVVHPVPMFLLMPPPQIKMPMFHHRHLFNYQLLD